MRRATEVLWKTPAIAALTVAVTSPVNRVLFRDQAGFAETGTAQLTLILFLTEIVFVAALLYPVLRSAWSGWKLFGAVLLAIFGLNVALTQVEAAVFLTIPAAEVASSVLSGTVHAAVVALLVVLAYRRRADDRDAVPLVHTSWSAGRWVRRLALCAVCYVALYFLAGSLIWPFIRDFYATQEISTFAQSPWILPFQLLRGTLYVLFLLPLLRSLPVARRQAVLAMAVLVPVLAGAPSLLIPNPYMPEHVRLLHMAEIGWSNFVYGALIAFLFWSSRQAVASAGDTGEEAAA